LEKYRLCIKSYRNLVHFIVGTPAILDKENEKEKKNSVCKKIEFDIFMLPLLIMK